MSSRWPSVSALRGGVRRLSCAAIEPVDAAWLAAFRVIFGLTVAVSMGRFLAYGWVQRFFVAPAFHFKYWGFEWVQALPGPAMHVLVAALIVLGLLLAVGLCTRISALLLALGVFYLQLLDVSIYLNHYYLAGLLLALLAVAPSARVWSVDAALARRGRSGRQRPAESQTVARVWLWLFRLQVGVVYLGAALAKAQPDWLVHGQPLRIWLGQSVDLPLIGSMFTVPWVPVAMSWAGFLYDLTIVPLLCWSRSRRVAFVVLLLFHTLTRVLFPIGMFPVIMTVAALSFFPPDWPRPWLARAARFLKSDRLGAASRSVAIPRAPSPSRLGPLHRSLGLLLAIYAVVQVALPLRAFAYGGNVLWHEQGMRFSWRVMVRAKGGSTEFLVEDARSGARQVVHPRRYLTPYQEMEMSGQPDLILQLAHHIERDMRRRTGGPVHVRAITRTSLNGRVGRPIVDPTLDLTEIQDGLSRADWVTSAPLGPPPHTRPVL